MSVVQHVKACFPCSVRNEYCNPHCNLFMDNTGTVIISCCLGAATNFMVISEAVMGT